MALRPLGAAWGYRYARALAASGQPERAREVIDRERHFHPEFDQTRQARFEIAAFTESPAEALATLRDAARPPAAFTGAEVEAWEAFLKARASGATADADLAAAKLRTTVQERRMSRQLAFRALVTLSRMDDAYAAVAEAGPELIAMGGSGWLFDPGMEAAWRDPRFWPLAARTGLIRYWRTRNVLPDFCATPGLPYDCRTEMAKYG